MSSVQEMHSSKVRPGLSSPLACALFAFERDEGGRVTDMRVLEANKAFLAFSGAGDRSLVNEACLQLFSGSLIPSFKWQEVLFPLGEAGQPPLVLEYLEPSTGSCYRIEAFSLGAGTLTFSCLDVSGVKEEERELRASHQRLVSILDTIPQAVFWKDREGIYRGCNRVFARNIGLEDGQEVLGKRDSELPIPADLAAAYREDDREVLESAQVKAHILEPLVHEGEPCQWLDVTKIPLKNADGVVDTLLGVYENVTERKLVEDALLESEARLQKSANFLHEVVEAIAQPFVVIEVADYRISLANSAAGGSEALGKCCYEHFYHLTAPCRSGGHVCPIERLRTECRSTTVEHVMPDDAGDTKHIQVNAWPMSNGRGQLKRIIVHRMDITERKQVASDLQRSEERFRYLVQNSSDIIQIIDRRGQILFISERVSDILGYAPAELVGHNCFSGIHPEDQTDVMTLFSEGLAEIGAIRDIEYRYRHRDGSWVWLHAVGVNHLYNPVIGGVVLNIRDVTQARRSREELQVAREAADRANRWKSRFLANMSHEVRTPLNGVLGFTELLSQTPLDDIQQQYVHNVQVSGEALLGIVNDILDFSKIEAGKLDLDPVEVELAPLVEETVAIVRWHADRKGLSLRLSREGELPRFVVVDPLRLKQILINLLGNAVKFTDRGEVVLVLCFEPGEGEGAGASSGAGRGRFGFTVRDTGIGIPESQLKRLFKAFSQADNSTTRKFGGTGLGLVISNLLAQKMGSRIEVESREGEGSSFTFTLELDWRDAPQEDPGAGASSKDAIGVDASSGVPDLDEAPSGSCREGEPVPSAGTEAPSAPSPVVLVAEDVEMNLVLVKTFIRRMRPDVEVIGVADGKAALDVIASRAVDLVFMDVQMPVMDGLEATASIRTLEAAGKGCNGTGRRVPIVALTAGAIEEERERALASGMDDFLTKPIDISSFRETLNRWLSAP